MNKGHKKWSTKFIFRGKSLLELYPNMGLCQEEEMRWYSAPCTLKPISLLETGVARPLDSHTFESLEFGNCLYVFIFFTPNLRPSQGRLWHRVPSALGYGVLKVPALPYIIHPFVRPWKPSVRFYGGDRRNKSTLHNYVCSLKGATNISIRHILQSKYSCDNKGCQFRSKNWALSCPLRPVSDRLSVC